jgi:hypothetical protein
MHTYSTSGITRLWKRNPPEELDSAGNYLLMDEELLEEWDSAGITSSWTRNLPEEWDSSSNYQLMDKESTRGIGFCQQLPTYGQGIHQRNRIPPVITSLGRRNQRQRGIRPITAN